MRNMSVALHGQDFQANGLAHGLGIPGDGFQRDILAGFYAGDGGLGNPHLTGDIGLSQVALARA